MNKAPDTFALIVCAILITLISVTFWFSIGAASYHHQLIESITILTVVGGFSGGLSMFIYMRPHNFADGFVRAVVCIMAANMLTQLVGTYLTKNQTTGELWGVAFLIGFTAWPIFGAIAKFFENRKASDITDLVKDIKLPGKDR